jgi:hypothetical protein
MEKLPIRVHFVHGVDRSFLTAAEFVEALEKTPEAKSAFVRFADDESLVYVQEALAEDMNRKAKGAQAIAVSAPVPFSAWVISPAWPDFEGWRATITKQSLVVKPDATAQNIRSQLVNGGRG